MAADTLAGLTAEAQELINRANEIHGPLSFEASSNQSVRRSDLTPVTELLRDLACTVTKLGNAVAKISDTVDALSNESTATKSQVAALSDEVAATKSELAAIGSAATAASNAATAPAGTSAAPDKGVTP